MLVRLPFLIILALCGALAAAHADSVHIIKKGETIYSLSRNYGVSIAQIEKVNPRLDKNQLKVGQRVVIPGTQPSPPPPPSPSPKPPTPPPADTNKTPPPLATASTYKVQKGDTLSSIARSFKVSPDQIKNWNRLSGNTIQPGQVLKVASGDTPVKTPDAEPPVKPPGSEPPPDDKRDQLYQFVSKIRTQLDAPRVEKGRWKYIVVHHSGTPSGNAKAFEYYHRYVRHMENGLAYHFVIGNGSGSGDGEIEIGNRWKKQLQGGHLASESLNEIALGICLVGDFDNSRPTRRQIAALIELIDYLQRRTTVGTVKPKLKLHREINPKPTDCPGKYFPGDALHRIFG